MEKRFRNPSWTQSTVLSVFCILPPIVLLIYAIVGKSETQTQAVLVASIWTFLMIILWILVLYTTPRDYLISHQGISLQFMLGNHIDYAWNDVEQVCLYHQNTRRYSEQLLVINGKATGNSSRFCFCNTVTYSKKISEYLCKFWRANMTWIEFPQYKDIYKRRKAEANLGKHK